jgi:hypothetical protein
MGIRVRFFTMVLRVPALILVFCGLSVQREREECVRDQIDRFRKSVHTASCVLCFVSTIPHGIGHLAYCIDTRVEGCEEVFDVSCEKTGIYEQDEENI